MFVAAGDLSDKKWVQVGKGNSVDGTYPGFVYSSLPAWAEAMSE